MIKQFFKMSALRQSLALSLTFLLVLALGGGLLQVFLSREFRMVTDEVLKKEFAALATELNKSGDFSRTAIEDLQKSTVDEILGFRMSDGSVLGPLNKDVFDVDGFQTLPDIRAISENGWEEVVAFFQREFDEEDLDDADFAIEIGASPIEWRIYVAPVAGGKLALAAPKDPGFFSDVSLILLATGLVLSALTLPSGILYGLRAQRRLNHIADGLKRIAEGDLGTRVAPEKPRDDLDAVAVHIDDATRRLQVSMQQVSEFSTNIAHDLRTPLTRLRVHLEQTRETGAGDGDLDSAIQQTDEILAIFNAIHRIAKLETRERRAQFQPIELGKVVEKTDEIYQAVVEDSGRLSKSEITDPITVHGDMELLVQLLANLIENAVHHTPDGTDIILFADRNSIGVRDNGPGIPVCEHKRIFEPLYRLDRSRNAPGTGLGLSLVKAIADLHDAKITMSETQPDGGLSVRVEFPVR